MDVVVQILMKALTNLPHTDIVLAKCLLTQDLLEMCQFKTFWKETNKEAELVNSVAGFEDSVRKFVCHVISVSYQTIEESTLQELLGLVDENAIKVWIDKYG